MPAPRDVYPRARARAREGYDLQLEEAPMLMLEVLVALPRRLRGVLHLCVMRRRLLLLLLKL